MSTRLRILHLEDDPDYSRFVQELLSQEGVDAEVALVKSRAEFEAALDDAKGFDIILADYSLPDYTGIQALAEARKKTPRIPFLIVSGTIGEQAAIDSLQAGATDYVLKPWTERLIPAIKRAVRESQERERRCKAESELVRREKYFRALTENALDVFTVLNAHGDFIYNSPSIQRMLGYRPEELIGQNAFALIHSAELPQVLGTFQRALEHPELQLTETFRFKHKDGSWCWLEVVGRNRLDDPEIAGMVINARDISGRRQVEETLRESEQRFRDLVENSPDGIFVEDLNGCVLDVNPAACRLHEATREQLIGRSVADLVPPDQREAVAASFQKLAAGEAAHAVGESLSLNGKVTPVEVRASRIHYGGRPAILLHVRDLTERKKTEAALKSSELLFRAVWENSLDGMRLTDENGIIVTVNNAFCKLVSLPREKLIGRPFTAAYSSKDDLQVLLADYRDKFSRRVIEHQFEFKANMQDGKTAQLKVTKSFIQLSGHPTLMLSLFSDVTGQRRLEEQLRQSQKMEAIGQLAGGVAHDFNNILTVIHGHASLLEAAGGLSETGSRSLHQIVQSADRAAGLTRQLLTFSRRQVMQPRRLDMNDIAGNISKMLGRVLGENITVQVNNAPRPALVNADAGMIEQMLLNLSVNARDAMPNGGQLTIGISVLNLSEDHMEQHPEARTGRFVRLVVEDTGSGISPECLPRIFEPFFTTKEVGKGTGLGLATVYGVINQHNGWIEVESELNKGTTFRVFLPSAAETTSDAEEMSPEVTVRGGRETILVVEDEAPVRELVCGFLRGLGYNVLEAASGMKALDVWGGHKGGVDLLLTDLVMPDGVNGRELAERLCAQRPRLKVIFTSGYSADVVGREFVLRAGLNYLQKPYPPRTLALAVRDCLDGAKSQTGPTTAA